MPHDFVECSHGLIHLSASFAGFLLLVALLLPMAGAFFYYFLLYVAPEMIYQLFIFRTFPKVM